MTKQPEDAATRELPLRKKPGRTAQYSSQAERQAAYRQRQQRAHSEAVDALRAEIERLSASQVDLHELQQQLQAREDAVAQREAALLLARKPKPIDKHDQKLRDLQWRVDQLESELGHWKFKKSSRIAELLKEKIVMPNRDLAAVFLVDFANKPIEKGYEFERATKAALEFGRKAASAGSAIGEIVGKLDRKTQITYEEKAVLDAAQKILVDIHYKTTRIKEGAKHNAAVIKAAEEVREKAAIAAIDKAFPDISLVQMTAFLGQRYWDFNQLRLMRPERLDLFDLDYHVADLEKYLRWNLRDLVIEAIKKGQKADDAANALRDEYHANLPAIEAKHKADIDNLNACQVAAVLMRANKK